MHCYINLALFNLKYPKHKNYLNRSYNIKYYFSVINLNKLIMYKSNKCLI